MVQPLAPNPNTWKVAANTESWLPNTAAVKVSLDKKQNMGMAMLNPVQTNFTQPDPWDQWQLVGQTVWEGVPTSGLNKISNSLEKFLKRTKTEV